MALVGEGVLCFPAYGHLFVNVFCDIFCGLAHPFQGEKLGQLRVGETPAQRRVVDCHIPSRVGPLRLGHDKRGAAHTFHPARQHNRRVAGHYLARAAMHSLHRRAAQPVERRTRHCLGQSGQEQGHARHIAVVLSGLVDAAQQHIFDGCWVYAGPFHQRADHKRGQIVRAHRRKRAAVTTNRCTQRSANIDIG